MSKPEFIHLHLHTEFSLLDGAIRHGALMDRVKEHGARAVGVTDHGNLFGAIGFYEAATKRELKPILGCELYYAPGSRFEKRTLSGHGDAFHHLTVLAMNEQGYRNLCQLVSRAFLEGFYYKPRIDWELLSQYHEGLIVLSGCLGSEVSQTLLREGRAAGEKVIERYRDLLGDRYYLEVQQNEIGEQEQVNDHLIAISKRMGIPLVGTNDCHYLTKEDATAHDILLCIQTGAKRDDDKRFRFQGESFYVRSSEEMAQLFSNLPQAVTNTVEIAERCDLKLEFGKYTFPHYEVPEGKDLDAVLSEQAWEGLEPRLRRAAAAAGTNTADLAQSYRERLEYELGVIRDMKFPGYFLIVADFINYAKRRGIPVGPGRGSAAGSLAAYCLGITDIDPMRYDLIFERFLNPERKSMPDIDVDFCQDGREEVIRYVTEKYGSDHVAQIATFGTLQAKAAVRDVGRGLGFTYGEVDRVAKLIPNELKITIEKALGDEPKLKQAMNEDPRIAELIQNAQALEGLTRHSSTHAAGVVIGSKPLVEHLPIFKGPKGELITQYTMNHVEKIGLIKFDFLGLKTLTVLDRAVRLVRENRGVDLDLNELDLADGKTYELLCASDTAGVFQLESSGIRDLLMRMKPTCFEDLIALVALYRPGPLESGMADTYIRRKHGGEEVSYDHPTLEDILRETYGVIVYQEQVMQIASALSSFSMGEADILRKAMGKKIPEEMERIRARFVDGAKQNGVDPALAKKIYDDIVKFAGYGFNKSHSAAYAFIAFQTAYLKAHYRVEFMAALLTCDMNNTDKVTRYITESRENGIEVLPPDVQRSRRDFGVVEGAIQVGLAAIKNVGGGAVDSILAARDEGGAFESFLDFLKRIDTGKANRRVIEALIKAGAFDSLGRTRGVLWRNLEDAMNVADRARRESDSGQTSLFGALSDDGDSEEGFRWQTAPDWEDDVRFAYEREALGFYVSGHPLEQLRDTIEKLSVVTTAQLGEHDDGDDVAIVGVVTAKKDKTTRKGGRMAFLTVQDLHGSVEVIAFPEVFAAAEDFLDADEPVHIRGKLDQSESGAKVVAEEVQSLAEAHSRGRVHITVESGRLAEGGLVGLRDLLQNHPGACGVVLHLVRRGVSETVLTLPPGSSVRPTQALMRQLSERLGSDAVWMAP